MSVQLGSNINRLVDRMLSYRYNGGGGEEVEFRVLFTLMELEVNSKDAETTGFSFSVRKYDA